MNKYKSQFIELINKHEDLISEQQKKFQEARTMDININACINDIDKIFCDIKENNPNLYNEMYLDGKNSLRANFENNGNLIEICKNMGYTDPLKSIKISQTKLSL